MTIGRIPSVEGGIQPTIFDAKGDLLTATAGDTPARIAVGNSGETLVADSSTSTGLRWNAPVGSLANPIINGGMDVWQRGTSLAVTSGSTTFYTADRWLAYRGATGLTVSRQTVSDATNLPNIQYAMRFQRDSGNTSTAAPSIRQSLESANAIPFAGKTITLSWYARAGANYSAASSVMNYEFVSGTGTDQNNVNGYTGGVTLLNSTVTLTTSWQRFAVTATLPTNSTEFATVFSYTPVGTAGANDWFEITGVQIDVGTYTASTAPTFRRSGGTLQGELAACQRYYEKTYAQGTAPATATNSGMVGLASSGINNTATTYFIQFISYKVTKRGTPTITIYDDAGNSGKVNKYEAVNAASTANITGNTDSITDSDFRIYITSVSGFSGFAFHYIASAEL